MNKIFIVILGVSLLSGCQMKEFSSTPFYEGNTVKYTGAVEDRVNLWPVAYWREPVGSVAWPLVSFGNDHFALRPLYSQYKKSGMGEYDEYNVLWPIAQFDTEDSDYRIFPFFWGSDYSKDPYFCLFPAVWYNDEFAGVFPFFWSTDKSNGGFCLFPLFWAETLSYRDGFWHTLFPLYYYKSYEAKDDIPSTSKFWTLCGLAGYNRSGGEFTDHRFWPFYHWERGNFYSIPYARYQKGSTIKNRILLGLAGNDSNTNGEYMASWVFPLYFHNKNKEEFFSLIYGSAKDSSWLLPLYYRDSKRFITPICGKTENADWTIPLYIRDKTKFSTVLFSKWNDERKGEKGFFSLPILSGANWSTNSEKSYWYALAGLAGFKTDATGKDSSQWALPIFLRDKDKGFYSLLYSWKGGGTSQTNRYFACGLAGTRSNKTEGGWLFPVFDYKKDKSFNSLLYSWDGGGTSKTNSYYALSLAGKRSGSETGWWLFPFYNKKKDADYDKEYSYLDMDKLPEEIKIWDAVYTNWTWNAKKDCREIESIEPIKEGTYFYSYNNADLCLVSDNDRNVSGSVPWKGKVYKITYNHDQGNRLAYRYEGERNVTFDISTRKKISDLEEGESSLFFFLYNASHKRNRMMNKSCASRKVLLKLWDWKKENGDVSLDVFPGFTYDSKTNGYTKTSFLWRFFRYQSDPKEGTSVDILFVPVWR